MTYSIHQFAKVYTAQLAKYVRVLPPHLREALPEAIRHPSFVVSCVDKSGQSFVALHGSKTTPQLVVDGKTLNFDALYGTVFVKLENSLSIEQVLFPPARAGNNKPSIKIGNRWVLLDGLAFCNSDFAAAHWRDKPFVKITAGDIPFALTCDGSVLVVNMLFGYDNGTGPIETTYEVIHAFGNETMLPSDEAGVSDFAFLDFLIANSGATKEVPQASNWSFTRYLESLTEPVARNVLVLGKYSDEQVDRFNQLSSVLRELYWNPLVLKDSPDLPIQSSTEKFHAALMCSRFVIVIDDAPSGHISELTLLGNLRWRPVVVLRTAGPATMFIEDKIRTDPCFRIAQINELTRDSLIPHIEWALSKVEAQVEAFNEINTWR